MFSNRRFTIKLYRYNGIFCYPFLVSHVQLKWNNWIELYQFCYKIPAYHLHWTQASHSLLIPGFPAKMYVSLLKSYQNFERWLNERILKIIWSIGQQLSSARSGHLVPTVRQWKLLNQSSFRVEWACSSAKEKTHLMFLMISMQARP